MNSYWIIKKIANYKFQNDQSKNSNTNIIHIKIYTEIYEINLWKMH